MTNTTNANAAPKRSFYNKEFTKEMFYQSVTALLNGDDIEDAAFEKCKEACAYELETITLRRQYAASKSREKGVGKNAIESDYAVGLKNAIMPYLTSNPLPLKELAAMAEADGKKGPSGKPYTTMWIGRVLNDEAARENPKVVCEQVIVETVDSKGLKKQSTVKAYRLA